MPHHKTLTIVTLVLVVYSLSPHSCVFAEAEQEQLQASQLKWEQLRASCAGNYSYTVTTLSFTGYRTSTTITIRDNKVHQRKYEAFAGAPRVPLPLKPGAKPPVVKPLKSWTETGAKLGTHKEGAKPQTLDILYELATKIVKRDLAPHEKRYIRFFKNGLLKSCFTIDTRIADDAPINGVNINSITLSSK
ncbi:MAG: hypothetical protein NZ744_11135 [Pirellulaceae bacterium]|nr:hypothetical protein [Pirellulaceae bacterium]